MENSILIYYDNKPFITVLVHKLEFLSLNQILDLYAEWSGADRSKVTGQWMQVIDITNCQKDIASLPHAQNDWP
jgi:hypothetical protein